METLDAGKFGKVYIQRMMTTKEFEDSSGYPEGYIEREIARKMVDELPKAVLIRLFAIEKISFEDEITDLTGHHLKMKIHQLQDMAQIEYSASVFG